jgi:hypothetical protein
LGLGATAPPTSNRSVPQTRTTVRLDEDLVDHFLREVDGSGGAKGYPTLIKKALRQHAEGKAPKLEENLRRMVGEKMRAGLEGCAESQV